MTASFWRKVQELVNLSMPTVVLLRQVSPSWCMLVKHFIYVRPNLKLRSLISIMSSLRTETGLVDYNQIVICRSQSFELLLLISIFPGFSDISI
jgi:hypothetical protein